MSVIIVGCHHPPAFACMVHLVSLYSAVTYICIITRKWHSTTWKYWCIVGKWISLPSRVNRQIFIYCDGHCTYCNVICDFYFTCTLTNWLIVKTRWLALLIEMHCIHLVALLVVEQSYKDCGRRHCGWK